MKILIILILIIFVYLFYYPIIVPSYGDRFPLNSAAVLSFKANTQKPILLKRISENNILYSVIDSGIAPSLLRIDNDALKSGQGIKLNSLHCDLSFSDENMGVLNCGDKGKFEFKARFSESYSNGDIVQDNYNLDSGEYLAKIEGYSDELIGLNIEIEETREILEKLSSDSLFSGFKEVGEQFIKKDNRSSLTREALLRSSLSGQEILLSSRLLSEEARYINSQNILSNLGQVEPSPLVNESLGTEALREPIKEEMQQDDKAWWKDLE